MLISSYQSCFFLERKVLSKQTYFQAYLAELWVEIGWNLVLSKVVYLRIYCLSFRKIRILRLEAVNRQKIRLNSLFLQRKTSIRLRRVLNWSRSMVIFKYQRQSLTSLSRKDLKEEITLRCKLSVLLKSLLPSKAGVLRSQFFYFLCWSKSWEYSCNYGTQLLTNFERGSLGGGCRKQFCIVLNDVLRTSLTNC